MAEALAISAAVVQFLDIGLRLSIKLSEFVSEFKDAPDFLRGLKSSLDRQMLVAQRIRSTHPIFSSSSATCLDTVTLADDALAEYLHTMEQLMGIVQSVCNEQHGGKFRKSWNTIRSIHKRKEIEFVCAQLQRQESRMTLWFITSDAKLSLEIKQLLEETQSGMKVGNEDISRRLDEAASQANNQLRHLPSLLSIANSTSTDIKHLTSRFGTFEQTSTDLHAQLQGFLQEQQSLAPTFHKFKELLSGNAALARTISHTITQSQQVPVSDNPNDALGISDALSTVYSRDLQQGNNSSSGCTCRIVNQTAHVGLLSFVHFKKVFRRCHYRRCPKFNTSERSLEYIMTILPPTWLFGHTINLSMAFRHWGSMGGWSISPVVLRASRLVDASKSPAFQAVNKTWTSLKSTNYQGGNLRLKELEGTIRNLFENHQASARDEDCNGNTLLYEVLDMLLGDGRRRDGTHDIEYLPLINYILDSGANTNVYYLPNNALETIFRRRLKRGGTVLDMFAKRLLCDGHIIRIQSETAYVIYKQLVKNDGEFSKPLGSLDDIRPDYWFEYFSTELEELQTFPEQLEICGFNDLVVAIINRSEKDLKKAITHCNIDESSPANGLAAIHFAIYWPLALKELIAIGANINCEDHHYRRPIHLAVACRQSQAVRMLLEADCAIATPDHLKSLLWMSLSSGQDCDQITDLIIDALANRHTRLIELALSVLPYYLDLEQWITEGVICETGAVKIAQKLATYNCSIPDALELDNGKSVYDTVDFHASRRLAVPQAEKLWGCGFRRIDECVLGNGLTPLLQSWFIADFDMISWLIGKGANPFAKHRDALLSGLHLFAAGLSYSAGYFDYNSSTISIKHQHIIQLWTDENCYRDSCSCLCSMEGCTPLSIVAKQSWALGSHQYPFTPPGIKSRVSIWRDKMLYLPEDPDHQEQLLRSILFRLLKISHTCCYINHNGDVGWGQYSRIKRHRQAPSNELLLELRKTLDLSLDVCRGKMLRCHCPISEKPVCAAFYQHCEAPVGTEQCKE